MTTPELLSHLNRLNVTLRSDNGQLILKAPKGAVTPALRAELTERKAEILAYLNDGGALPKEPSLQPVFRSGKLPLSFSQQRLWFLDQYEPGKPFYNIPFGLRFSGPLNITALEQSLDEIIRRHELLRTVFSVVDGEPVQIIAPPVRGSLALVDLRDRSENEREDETRRLANGEARRAFDLREGPLCRTTLIRLAEDDHLLVLVMHHIVSDGWSMGVFHRELSSLYRAFSQSQPSPLADLPIQYADYAVWQRQWFKGPELERQLSYWKKQLGGAPVILSLPTDHPRPAVQSYRGARRTMELSGDLTRELKALSRKEGVTLFMTLLAAFQTLLYRYTGQEDLLVGSPIANRTRTEIEPLIGFFVNTLVLRGDLSGNPTFRQVLHRVRKVALEAYEHQDLPFEKLVEELNPQRSLSHAPLFQVMFVLQNAPAAHRDLPGLTWNQVKLDNGTTKFDLSVAMIEQSDGIKGSLEYSTDLFDEATIIRLSRHFTTLLEGIVADPEQCISDLPILTGPERRELLIGWNDTKRDYARDKCIHRWFEEQVEKTPEAIAVVFEDTKLTYRELNRRANHLARYLIGLGVGPEIGVGICVERSPELIIGILGILKAGGAYIPLDPCLPKERMAFICKDTRIPVLLSQERLIEALPPFTGELVCLDRDWERISRESNDNPESGATAENLAYIIYTSGSTGRPKGVQVSHSGVVNVLTHVKESLGVSEQDAIPLVANICFDISVMEFFLPLVTGARLIVASTHVALDGGRLERMLSDHRMTILHATPATWRVLLQTAWSGLDGLTILSGGEALQSDLAGQLLTKGHVLWNLYGPTETTIYSSAAAYRPGSHDPAVSIGRPIANTQIYILDNRLQPLPVGVAGQLCIGGDGLTRGYLNRPDLTAEGFVPNPFSNEPGARLYTTGDSARYLPDGNIEVLGRMDHQIKLRGFRIEPGEIESVLSEHPGIFQSIVLAREDTRGDKRLVAYVVTRGIASGTANQLRAYLKEKLPEYMVPSAYVFLEDMPLTSNGKLDRKALPAPDRSYREFEHGFAAPGTPVEEMIAGIWAEVLKLEKIGIHDNFFDLGGHSLKATQVMSRVCEALQVDLPLRVLFEAPTVAELAARVEQSMPQAGELEELARSLAEVESLSDEEIERLLAKDITKVESDD
jgi:amino acid adenylation domain-containing protein